MTVLSEFYVPGDLIEISRRITLWSNAAGYDDEATAIDMSNEMCPCTAIVLSHVSHGHFFIVTSHGLSGFVTTGSCNVMYIDKRTTNLLKQFGNA